MDRFSNNLGLPFPPSPSPLPSTPTPSKGWVIQLVNYMPIKFQPSILINKKSFEKGGPLAPHKGRFAVHRRVNPHACISFSSIYAYQFSAFYLDKQKSGAFSPT